MSMEFKRIPIRMAEILASIPEERTPWWKRIHMPDWALQVVSLLCWIGFAVLMTWWIQLLGSW